ncbi:YwqJ-related putative deaminase [Pantoea rodasii]|nr:YwqJ-related putative deaminase [Pantoea rodasii]
MKFTRSKLKKYAAHAGYAVINNSTNEESGQGSEGAPTYRDSFLNLEGSLEKKKTFPGVTLINENIKSGFEEYSPDKLKKLTGPRRWKPEASLGYYVVTNIESFISGIRKQYSTKDYPLHPVVENRIREHVSGNNGILPKMAGIAGLHAEVQALNAILSSSKDGAYSHSLSHSYIFTQRLVGAGQENPAGADFPACFNCSGILSGLEHVMTGRVEHHSRLRRRKSF